MEGEKSSSLLINTIKTSFKSPSLPFIFLLFTVLAFFTFQITTNDQSLFHLGVSNNRVEFSGSDFNEGGLKSCSGFFQFGYSRKVVKSILEFGGVGDGKSSNTEAFREALEFLGRFKDKGGGQLNVPKGVFVTGSFNLTSNFTLFLQDGAVILGSQDPEEWPIIEPLPSYGTGRERPGGRHISLIHGNNLTNVVITGQNGTIDGQGKMWWDLWWNRTLVHTRGHLVELINSHNILISNLTFRNSPFWTIHPVYCSNVVVRHMTILAPLKAPNTDGIDPDSCINVCIEDCYIESGDDLVAIKSGWDKYGLKVARPSSNIIVRRVSGTTPTCSGVGIGSEMSGGVSNVIIEDLYIRDSAAGVRIKTDKGRGGYITNITINNLKMERVKVPLRFSRGANDHPGDEWDPKALPKVKGIFISNVISLGSKKAPLLQGVEGAAFEDICLKNVSILDLAPSIQWTCEFISGASSMVFPEPCSQLQTNVSTSLC
ncbi:hypothetical protein Leryth_015676 [Lithospermum erythrorhizon]|nr:hypothetical protein Leryth_015676 [Lithospermum erythrorhizon]